MTFAESFRRQSPFVAPSVSPADILGSFDVGGGSLSALLLRMLDEIDYGLVLVTATGRMRYANQLALRTLAHGSGLRLAGGVVSALHAAEQPGLRTALADAARGLRRMLSLGGADTAPGEARETIALVPMSSADASLGASDANAADGLGDGESLVLLVFGKQPASETLTLDFFARTHRLTGAESGVLHGLCAGRRPKEIAQGIGVAISTVRTQIGSIRVKTQTRSIRDLVNRVASLPPITPAMKNRACH